MLIELILALLLGIVLPCAVLIPAHFMHVKKTTTYGPLGTIMTMLAHYVFGAVLIVLLVMCGGCFNKILIPY